MATPQLALNESSFTVLFHLFAGEKIVYLRLNLGDRLVVAVHVAPDDISSFGEANRWFESYDKGRTWRETDPSVASECGLLLPDGDRIYFPMENGISLDAYEFEDQQYNTPDYDYSEKAAPGKMPLPDGMSFQMWGIQVNAYRTERLPEELDRSEWLMLRTPAGGSLPDFPRRTW